MTNRYEAPEVLKLGKAQDVIVDQKMPDVTTETLGIPMSSWNGTDDFDE